jgi:hypothetical protein
MMGSRQFSHRQIASGDTFLMTMRNGLLGRLWQSSRKKETSGQADMTDTFLSQGSVSLPNTVQQMTKRIFTEVDSQAIAT